MSPAVPSTETPWFIPLPISEATPDMGEILGWTGFRWVQCKWEDDRYNPKPRPYWHPVSDHRSTAARFTSKSLIYFIRMPPAP